MSGPPIPARILDDLSDWQHRLVANFESQTATYRFERGDDVRFLKVARADWFPSPESEAARMIWARAHLPVPAVLDHGSADGVAWLLTSALPGRDATDPVWLADPVRTARLLARGWREFHAAPVGECPFDFRLDAALDLAERRLLEERIVPERDFHEEFAHLSAKEAVRRLQRTRPATETLVVCHGDYCLPNVLIEDGVVSGYVDLGELGVADRWWDLAVATWSLGWNLGPGHEQRFLAEYGADLDPDRLVFYRLMYDVVS